MEGCLAVAQSELRRWSIPHAASRSPGAQWNEHHHETLSQHVLSVGNMALAAKQNLPADLARLLTARHLPKNQHHPSL